MDYLKKTQGLEISIVACGSVTLYNAYFPGGKHKARLTQKIEDNFFEIKKEPMPDYRYYFILEIYGCTKDGKDFITPPFQYCYK